MTPSNRVVIIGAGNVGSSIAYSLLSQEIAQEILILDIANELVNAQVLDMQDSANFTHGIKIEVGDYKDLIDGDIVVITCGVAQKEGETRIDLLKTNAGIIRNVVKSIKDTTRNVYLLMVTNPVDILTYIAVKESGLPEAQVFGSGTFLDTARLRVALSKETGVSSSSIHAYVMGEHGDTSFPVLSNASVSGISLGKFINNDAKFYKDIQLNVKDKAYQIIKGKKATYYGIGSAIARICKIILHDEKRIVPLSVVLNGEYGYKDISIGVPVLLSKKGVEFVGEIDLDQTEKEMMKKSTDEIRSYLDNI